MAMPEFVIRRVYGIQVNLDISLSKCFVVEL